MNSHHDVCLLFLSAVYIAWLRNLCMWCTCNSSSMVDLSCIKRYTSLIHRYAWWWEYVFSFSSSSFNSWILRKNVNVLHVWNGTLYSNVQLVVLQTLKTFKYKHQPQSQASGGSILSGCRSCKYNTVRMVQTAFITFHNRCHGHKTSTP